MSSTQSKLFNTLLSIATKTKFSKKFIAGNFSMLNCPEPPSQIRKYCKINKSAINGRNVFTLTPRDRQVSGQHVLYLHGGAYVYNFFKLHWKFLAELVRKTGCTITTPDYPLAPDHTYREAFAMAEALYKQLISLVLPENLVLMGDSAGGGFALALAQKIRNENIAQPNQIILLSPWLDIALDDPCINEVGGIYPLRGIEVLRGIGKEYAGDLSPEHYLLSPIHGSLKNLGKISVFTGTKDILVADARKLKSAAESDGIIINYFEYPDMAHDWMLFRFPESKSTRQRVFDLIQPK